MPAKLTATLTFLHNSRDNAYLSVSDVMFYNNFLLYLFLASSLKHCIYILLILPTSVSDDYFVERVKVIEDLTKSRKEKLLQMTKWSEDFQVTNSLQFLLYNLISNWLLTLQLWYFSFLCILQLKISGAGPKKR